MTKQPLRVLAFAYLDLGADYWNNLVNQNMSPEAVLENYIAQNKLKFTFLGAFGMYDRLRKSVKSCVKYARDDAKLGVRLVSGDHINTARETALKVGILKPGEENSMFAVMHADDFRQHLQQGRNKKIDEAVLRNLKVLARATA